MILSGNAIQQARDAGDILIDPYGATRLNPNSYNFHLSHHLLKVVSTDGAFTYERFDIPPDGLLLQPNCLYLGSTAEIIGSKKYAMTLLGRSSLGRLGIFLNATADLGHVGALGRWTLEISVVQPVRIYAEMPFGQAAQQQVVQAQTGGS